MREILRREFRAAGLEISTDGMGSIIGVLRGSPDGPRIMLAAHMDEVGAIVKYLTPEGMVKFQVLGGMLDQALVDQRWTILTAKGPVLGISGLKSIHVTPVDERSRVTPRDNVFLDVGVKSKPEAEALGIRSGDPIAPASSFAPLASGRYVGKALERSRGLRHADRDAPPAQGTRHQDSQHDLLRGHGPGGNRIAWGAHGRGGGEA